VSAAVPGVQVRGVDLYGQEGILPQPVPLHNNHRGETLWISVQQSGLPEVSCLRLRHESQSSLGRASWTLLEEPCPKTGKFYSSIDERNRKIRAKRLQQAQRCGPWWK
jgi:hypothetical protein